MTLAEILAVLISLQILQLKLQLSLGVAYIFLTPLPQL